MNWSEKYRRLGTGCGIEIRGGDLVAVIVKSRPAGVTVAGRLVIAGFRERPAAEWGAEFKEFLKSHGATYLAAYVALPRGELIVRELSMPPLGPKELGPAVAYQIDSLHPYGEAEVYHASAPLKSLTEGVNRLPVAVVIARRDVVDGYAALFEAAGINVAGFTVAAAAFHAGVRVRWDSPPLPFLLADHQNGYLNIYGESEQRPLVNAQFDLGVVNGSRAIQFAGADLRLQPECPAALVLCGDLKPSTSPEIQSAEEQQSGATEKAVAAADEDAAAAGPPTPALHDFGELFEPRSPEELLPTPLAQPSDFDLRRDAAALAVALEAACPSLGWKANLLPASRRRANSRWMFAPTAVLLALLAVLSVALLVRPVIQDARYVAAMQAELDRLNQIVGQVNSDRQQANDLRSRLGVLRQLELRTEKDLQILSELSRIIPPTAWVSNLEINDEGARITGEASEAAPLLGILDQSTNLTGAAFTTSLTRTEDGERFQVQAKRRVTEGEAAAPMAASAAAPPAEPPARLEAPEPVSKQAASSEAKADAAPARRRRPLERKASSERPSGADAPGSKGDR